MRFFGATGFVLTVLGIAGLDGAIYFGTGYLTSGALLAMRAVGLYIDYRRGRPGKGRTQMRRFTVMTMVRLGGKHRTVKVVGTKTLPYKRKEPVRAGSDQKQINVTVLIIARGKEKVNGKCKNQQAGN